MAKENTPEWKRKIISAARSKAGRAGARERYRKIQEGWLLPGQAGGRKPIPTVCPRCGEEQQSATSAAKHCRKPRRRRRSAADLAIILMTQPIRKTGGQPRPVKCLGCQITYTSRMYRSHKCPGPGKKAKYYMLVQPECVLRQRIFVSKSRSRGLSKKNK